MKTRYKIVLIAFFVFAVVYGSVITYALGLEDVFNPVGTVYFPSVVMQLAANEGNGIICVDACGPCSAWGHNYLLVDGECKIPDNVKDCYYISPPMNWKFIDGECIPVDDEGNLLHNKNCNNMDGKIEAQCFKDSFESCTPAITHSVIYTIEGDALYLEGVIADDCKIHVTFDNSGDRFGGSDKGINSYVCNNVELHEKHIWVIDDCTGYPEFQINYNAHEWTSAQKCTDLGGVWNYTFHNCVGIFDENQCLKSGGTTSCISYEQMGHSRDVCQRVCEFEPVDRK